MDALDLAGRAALWYAAEAGDANLVAALLERGAGPLRRDAGGQSAVPFCLRNRFSKFNDQI